MRCVSRRTSLQLLTESKMRPNVKRCESGVDVTQFFRQIRAKKFQNSRNSGTPRAPKNCVHSASERCACCKTLLKLTELKMRSDPKKRAFGVEITQTLRQNRAKELQNFGKFSARRAHKKLHALSLCALKLA